MRIGERFRQAGAWKWIPVVLAAALVLLVVASFFIDEPLRRYMESRVNASLKGYTARIGGLDFHLAGFSIDFRDIVVRQDRHPDPPLLSVRALHASVHWRALLNGRLVGDFRLERPAVHVDLRQLRAEVTDRRPFRERGWQDALQSLYPLKINRIQIIDGDFTYIDEDPRRPLRISGIRLSAGNIRNIRVADRVYPSEFGLEATVFGSGRAALSGRANFLSEPFPGLKASMRLSGVDLSYFRPVLSRSNLVIEGGTLSAEGTVEYAPGTRVLDLERVAVRRIRIDYVHRAATAAREAERKEEARRAAKSIANEPETLYRIRQLNVSDSEFGYVNRAASPPWRLHLEEANLVVTNLSNQMQEGRSEIRLTGAFMGSGRTLATASFRPVGKKTDMDVSVRIEGTNLVAMNDLLLDYGKFDVKKGSFSFYSEIGIRGDRVSGYIKPLFRNLQVYDARQDREKSLFRKLYQRLVGGVAHLLENRPRNQVATKADISGRLDDPRSSTWQILVRLIQNAFFRAILPGLDREITRK